MDIGRDKEYSGHSYKLEARTSSRSDHHTVYNLLHQAHIFSVEEELGEEGRVGNVVNY